MNQLDAKYRDGLKGSASTVYVNNEGRVVWVMEYLRYRLNGCNHNDATIRVFQQILGQGIQPVCRSSGGAGIPDSRRDRPSTPGRPHLPHESPGLPMAQLVHP